MQKRSLAHGKATSFQYESTILHASDDPEIGEMIADVLDHVGKNGIITVEEGRSVASEIEYIKDMQFDRGYISPSMVTDQDRMEAVLSNCHILITAKKITGFQELLPVLELLVANGEKQLWSLPKMSRVKR